MPEVTVVFEIKNTAGQPIEGMPVLLKADHYGPDRILNERWAQSLWGVTDKDGKYIINGLPERDHISFDIQPYFHFLGKPKGEDEKKMRENLSKYKRVQRKIENMPIDKKGYVIEVIMTRKGEKVGNLKKVQIYDSMGNPIGS